MTKLFKVLFSMLILPAELGIIVLSLKFYPRIAFCFVAALLWAIGSYAMYIIFFTDKEE